MAIVFLILYRATLCFDILYHIIFENGINEKRCDRLSLVILYSFHRIFYPLRGLLNTIVYVLSNWLLFKIFPFFTICFKGNDFSNPENNVINVKEEEYYEID